VYILPVYVGPRSSFGGSDSFTRLSHSSGVGTDNVPLIACILNLSEAEDTTPGIMSRNFEPRISVVIPTYNRASLLVRAVESVHRQTVQPEEILVVDDGSTDTTQEVAAKFGDTVRYLRQGNSGASLARNRGVAEAGGEWIAFLDSDDLWLPGHIEALAGAIRRTEGKADLYFCDMEMEEREGGGSLWMHCGFQIGEEQSLVQDGSDWVMMHRQPMMLQTSVVRRSTYLALGGLWDRLRTRHDTHFFIKLGVGRAICAVAGTGARQTSADSPMNRLMSAAGPAAAEFWEESIAMYRDLLSFAGLASAAHQRILRRRLADAYWRFSRTAARGGRFPQSIVPALRALTLDPAFLVNLVRRISVR
jgi:glycosyltransferase involved in cell wall biosynthesis